jgi:hypothetical protein
MGDGWREFLSTDQIERIPSLALCVDGICVNERGKLALECFDRTAAPTLRDGL